MASRATASPTAPIELVTFELGGQRCALLASDVVEVQRAVAIARMPRGPAIVEGVIDLRGKLVPVLDVRSRFGLPPSPLAPSDHLIVARVARARGGTKGLPVEARVVAIRVERALDLVPVARERIEDARSAVPGVEYVAGVAKLADGTVVIHDLRTFLSLDEERELDQALAGTGDG
ncbi:purine-binding chemotaxis protein CheW [bacterium]|nr:purine-binding chemotaxis protein CheW [bacterium]